MKTAAPDGTTEYTYNARNKLIKGELDGGSYSEYVYNALGARVQNVQYQENVNSGHENVYLTNGSKHASDYMSVLEDGRNTWQRTWETEVGTTVQSNFETVTKNYVIDYLSLANRDIMVYEEGSFTQRYVYAPDGARVSVELSYADDTERGDAGENISSDFADNDIQKVWYRRSLIDSTLFAVDEDGEVVIHVVYDPWGNALTETNPDLNFAGIDNISNFTGYSWDETLGLYFAQNRFYDAENHRFTQEDPINDGTNWYIYCENNSGTNVDAWGLSVAGYRYVNTNGVNLRNGAGINYDILATLYKDTEVYFSGSKLRSGEYT